MKGYYTLEVRDKEGKLLKRVKRKSRSFVAQYNQGINVQMSQAGRTIKDTANADQSVILYSANLRVEAGAENGDYGILVGRGSTAVTISDYNLETKCAEGTGTNELLYQATTLSAPSVSAPDCSFTVTRSAINNSGAAITVTEIGIICIIYITGPVPKYFLLVRDVLASSVEVPDGGAITVVYTIKVTV